MIKRHKLRFAITLTALIALGSSGLALADGNTVTIGSGRPVVYQAEHACCSGPPIVLGPQSKPTTLGGIPRMAAGTYLVQYTVGVVMGPNDAVVCAAGNVSHGNDGIFGTAGNGATDSGTGPAGVYGEADAVDTITVTKGQAISVTCNVGNYGQGTYVSGWSLTATEIGTLHKTTL